MEILPKSFYDRPTLQVAQDLLGCFLIRKTDNKIIKTKIVESEAYNGPADKASHASRGRTPRNAIMFGEPGLIYVYFTYGLHYMLNIVTEKSDFPAAVLIRAVEPVSIKNYLSSVALAEGDELKITNYTTNGPAKLTKALQIDKFFNGLPIYTKKYGLWIAGHEKKLEKMQIVKAKRVGVDYAGQYKDKLWRYFIKDSKFVSKK